MSETILVNLAIPNQDGFRRVLDAAAAVGFRVEQALPIIGVATGTINADQLTALRAIPGVASVEPDRRVQAR